MTRSYDRSEKLLRRAQDAIPLGAQTFSKSVTHLSRGASPFFIQKARGCRVWDVDGNEYIDFVNALAAVLLGYCDPDVDAAVRRQLEDGVSFSLSHPIETEVAEALIEVVPCAEAVRFGKNGSDATTAAVRLARGATGRDHVAVCGYHGWQDWYIGSTSRSFGVPKATQELTHSFRYNDLDSLQCLFDDRPGAYAAVILEPMAATLPQPGFLEGVRDMAHSHGAILIFDETVTGFRLALGGAQEFFGVTPDLATFGKGLANGLPLSAVTGRKELMGLMEEIFFSTTFGGETLSLAAAQAVLAKLRREPVIETLAAKGGALVEGLEARIAAAGLEEIVEISGHPAWSFVTLHPVGDYGPFELKTFVQQELTERGVLTLGTHNMSYAHEDEDVRLTLDAYEGVLTDLAKAIRSGTLKEELRGEVLAPLFTVR